MNHGHQFDTALSAECKAEQERKQAKREARKRLEAAAPDLLDACENILEMAKWDKEEFAYIISDFCHSQIKKAIAKAKQ